MTFPLEEFGSIQVPGDIPTLPWVRSRVWVGVGAGLGLGLALREGWVDTSPKTWLDGSLECSWVFFLHFPIPQAVVDALESYKGIGSAVSFTTG